MEMERFIIDEQDEDIGSPSSSESTINSSTSSSSDFIEDATSSDFKKKKKKKKKSPLYQMSELVEELPIKRGLSRYFQGKSKSFASLSNARCLDDLVKPQHMIRPSSSCKKRIKALKNACNGDLDLHTTKSLSAIRNLCCSRTIIKKPFSRGLKRLQHHHHRHGFLGSRPPIHPHASSNLSAQALPFA